MSVRTGREFLSIPGPTNIPDPVLNAMHQPAIDIYKDDFPPLTDGLLNNLKKYFGTVGNAFIYIANGHGAWEAALTNVMSKGEKILVLESGMFANGWGHYGAQLGLDVEILEGSWQRSIDPQAVKARLEADTDHEIQAILMVQVDTASSISNDIPAICAAIKSAGHPALIMVDTIASLGTMEFKMDEWGVDVAVSAAQKGLMSPPGLSFNAANDRAWERHQSADLKTGYWDWTFRTGDIHYMKYAGTPPEHLLFALDKSFEILNEESIEGATLRHQLLAGATWAAVEKWAEGGALSFNIEATKDRSTAVTTVLFHEDYNAADLLEYCEKKCNVIVGITIGELEKKGMRIAHMGYANAPMLLGTLGAIEMALQALNIPHGDGGVAAAIKYLSDNVPA
jgi:alanine-glyoxylate transaminase / serine-glyoxylate transaminase / serine-pyruvate transaminase